MDSTQHLVGLFKPVDRGYVFRAPYQTGLGKVRHYLVDNAQMAELTALIAGPRPMLTRLALVFAAVAAVLLASLIVYALSPHENPQAIDTLAMLLISAVFVGAGYLMWRSYKLRQIAPLIAHLTPTDLQITRNDIRKSVISAMSVKQLRLVTAVTALAAVVNLAGAAYAFSIGKTDVGSIITGIIFAGLTVYYVVQLMRRNAAARVPN